MKRWAVAECRGHRRLFDSAPVYPAGAGISSLSGIDFESPPPLPRGKFQFLYKFMLFDHNIGFVPRYISTIAGSLPVAGHFQKSGYIRDRVQRHERCQIWVHACACIERRWACWCMSHMGHARNMHARVQLSAPNSKAVLKIRFN
jgi:hypothetical protein